MVLLRNALAESNVTTKTTSSTSSDNSDMHKEATKSVESVYKVIYVARKKGSTKVNFNFTTQFRS